MATSLSDTIKALFERRRDKEDPPAAEAIVEELSLRDLRTARGKTQIALSQDLGVGQAGISRLENRSDMMLSTLRGYVEALGGELRLVVEFADRPPVHLKGLAADQVNKEAGRSGGSESSET